MTWRTADQVGEIPDTVIVDLQSGFTINMPLGPQDYPGWQEDRPEVIERIMALRKKQKIVIPDDMFQPKPVTVPYVKDPNHKHPKRPTPKSRPKPK